MALIADDRVLVYHDQLRDIIYQLKEQNQEFNNTDLDQTIDDLELKLAEPFLFVIVGEVKAGKSSFINALLSQKEEICKVAPDPCTDQIQQIKYGSKNEEIQVNPYFKKIFLPVEILQEISIVDTPGTNTIAEHHQEVTERFVPVADLIVFVFEAKNPYRQSAWDFFDFIHKDWQKKIIFVLQQKDLMQPADLQTNIEGLHKQAIKKGIEAPQIFAVSALEELQEKFQESGFIELRDYLKNNITGGRAPYLKIQNGLELVSNINEKIHDGLAIREKQLEEDIAFRKEIQDSLDDQHGKSENQIKSLIENLVDTYHHQSLKIEKELKSGLSFGTLIGKTIRSIFKRSDSPKNWLLELKEKLEKDLQLALKDKLNDGVLDLTDSIQNMVKIIDLKLQTNKTVIPLGHELFSHVADKRKAVLEEVRESFKEFISNEDNFTGDDIFRHSQELSPNVAAGGGLAVIGLILTALTQGVVFDITGGVLTTVGLLFAGISTGIKRRRIIEGFKSEMDKGAQNLDRQLGTTLRKYNDQIKEKIEANFEQLDNLIKVERDTIKTMNDRHQLIRNEVNELSQKVEKELK